MRSFFSHTMDPQKEEKKIKIKKHECTFAKQVFFYIFFMKEKVEQKEKFSL